MKKRQVEVLPDRGIARIPLGGRHGAGRYAIVDADDAELAGAYNWCLNRAAGLQYVVAHQRTENGKSVLIKLHRLIMNPSDGFVVDHINHNTLDNRRCNLRIVTHTENLHNSNRRARSSGGYVGVYKVGNRWQARICRNSRVETIGLYDTPEQARDAYDAAVDTHRDALAFRNVT